MMLQRPNKFLLNAIVVSVVLHAALIYGLIFFGYLKLKPTDLNRIHIRFEQSNVNQAQTLSEVIPTVVQSTTSKIPEPPKPEIPNTDNVRQSFGWGNHQNRERSDAKEQREQMQARLGGQRMQRQNQLNLSLGSVMGQLQMQGIQATCDIWLSEDFAAAKIQCTPPAIEGYVQSLLGPANLAWNDNAAIPKPLCIPIVSMGGTRKPCQ